MAIERRKGVIIRINEQGLGIVKDTQSQEQYVFTFDKITGYQGQSAQELGLVAGTHVRFSYKAGKVESVQICH